MGAAFNTMSMWRLVGPIALSAAVGACGRDPTTASSSGAEKLAPLDGGVHELTGVPTDHDPLLALAGDARFVLLGEATHGTHEFYRERARITKRLVDEHGFAAVAIEGDWPDAQRVNRYVRAAPDADATAEAALAGFEDFPRWMWRNDDVRDLVQWLRLRNDARPGTAQDAGFYGLDLYDVYEAADAVVRYLERVDAAAAERARQRYACFDRYGRDIQSYGSVVAREPARSCAAPAAAQFEEMRSRIAAAPASGAGAAADPLAAEEAFSALQSARVVKNGEAYFRVLYGGVESTWNLRDRHMAEALEAIAQHAAAQGRLGKVVVWAHNTHAGDARATEMGMQGELNLGQLMRTAYGNDAVLVGFTTYTGTVMAASNWGEPGKVMRVRPSIEGSYGALFRGTGLGDFLLILRGAGGSVASQLASDRLQRAIGVIYRPETERQSHYFGARLAQQFDAVIHIDETRAVEALAR